MMVMTTTMLKMMTMMMITDIEDGGFQSCAALKISRDQLQYQHEHIIVVITIIINKMASVIAIIIGGNFEQFVSSDRSSCTDDGPRYIRGATFSDFHSVH